jgi:drug/metabolite transporter (DMT)-like permease
VRTLVLTASALACFAANSILCRLALRTAAIDPASFSTVRLVSGAAALAVLARLLRRHGRPRPRGDWMSAGMLFLYAVPFAFAYLSLSAGTGALILFGCVQSTMIVSALRSGERPHHLEWGGLFLATAGLVYLVLPGLDAPAPRGFVLMVAAGIAWGLYSLHGRGATDPLLDTAGNFARAVPLAAAVSAIAVAQLHLSLDGVLLATASGALASGVGYAVWYTALRGLTATRAATVQLCVPVLASIGGVLFLSETVTTRLVVATVLVLGGVALAVWAKTSN